MSSSFSLKLVCVLVVCLVVGAPSAQGAMSCNQVTGALLPCLGYLRAGGAVPADCCAGIKNLNNSAKTTADRQTACNCIKGASSGISGINFGFAAGLPGKCGVTIPYKISPTTDCKSVK